MSPHLHTLAAVDPPPARRDPLGGAVLTLSALLLHSRWLMSHSRWLMVGAALIWLLMLPTFALSQWQPQQFHGIDAFIKPLRFQLSFGLYLLCLAWLRSHLTPAGRARRVAVLTDVVPALAAFGEVAYILWRASRGEASHFNVASPVASALYGLMGIGALLVAAVSAAVRLGRFALVA